MGIKKENVVKALQDLEGQLPQEEEVKKSEVAKASDKDLDQPEGADLGQPSKKKLSDEAKGGFKAKKSEAKEEEEVEMKSFDEDLPEEIETKIDVSEFLKSLVDHTSEAINGLSQVVQKSQSGNEEVLTNVSKAIVDIHEGQGKLAVVLKAICEKIGVIGTQPARAPKAETDVNKSGAPVEREFSSSLSEGGGEEPLFKGLSENPKLAKAQISGALTDLVKKGECEDLDLISFETSNFLKPELVTKLKQVSF